MNEPEITRLRTGAEVPGVLVKSTSLSLRHLMETNPIAFYEAAMMAREPDHAPFGNTGRILQDAGFSADGVRLHSAVRDIILASVDGDGFDLRLVSPYAEVAP